LKLHCKFPDLFSHSPIKYVHFANWRHSVEQITFLITETSIDVTPNYRCTDNSWPEIYNMLLLEWSVNYTDSYKESLVSFTVLVLINYPCWLLSVILFFTCRRNMKNDKDWFIICIEKKNLFNVFCIVHSDTIIQHKPTKCRIFYINI